MDDKLGVFIAVVAVCGGLGVAYYAMWLNGQKRKMRHSERMAMIEKGLMPPLADGLAAAGEESFAKRREQRRSGVFMICFGIGLSFMFGLANNGWRTVWIGILIAMIGVAELVNAILDEREEERSARRLPPSGEPRQPL